MLTIIIIFLEEVGENLTLIEIYDALPRIEYWVKVV